LRIKDQTAHTWDSIKICSTLGTRVPITRSREDTEDAVACQPAWAEYSQLTGWDSNSKLPTIQWP
jgi:hypothetical protein